MHPQEYEAMQSQLVGELAGFSGPGNVRSKLKSTAVTRAVLAGADCLQPALHAQAGVALQGERAAVCQRVIGSHVYATDTWW